MWLRRSTHWPRSVVVGAHPLCDAFSQLEKHSESANLRQCYVNFFPLCSPRGSTIFGRGLPYLAMVKNPSILSWIQMPIRIKINQTNQNLISSKISTVYLCIYLHINLSLLTASAFNWLGQHASSPGNCSCHVELTVSSLVLAAAIASTLYGWPIRVGMGG